MQCSYACKRRRKVWLGSEWLSRRMKGSRRGAGFFQNRGLLILHSSNGLFDEFAAMSPIALAFCLHLEVAQVGISWNFLQENA
jgi:hypothetical protein